LHGYETWSLKLREEHRLREYENRFLRRMCGTKKEEVARVWRRLHDEELHDLYASAHIIRAIKSRMMGWAGHAARMGSDKKCIQNFGWKI